jgi:hypothetical protein
MKLDVSHSLYCDLPDCGGRIADVLADGRILRIHKGQPDIVPVGSSLLVTCGKYRILGTKAGVAQFGHCPHQTLVQAVSAPLTEAQIAAMADDFRMAAWPRLLPYPEYTY